MAKNKNTDDTNKMPSNPILKGIRSLNNITKATNTSTYGVSNDVAKTLSSNVNDYINELLITSDRDRNLVNSHMTRSRLYNNSIPAVKPNNSLYNLVADSAIMDSAQSLIGGQNVKFVQLLKDYEIIKRCIPQVHKVITSLKNGIISPDAMANSAIGIETPSNITAEQKDQINNIIEKYELNSKLSNYVLEYLIASVKYVTVVPYSKIVDMLESGKTITECISDIETDSHKVKTLYDYSPDSDFSTITESIDAEYYEDDNGLGYPVKKDVVLTAGDVNGYIKSCLQNIEFIKGGEEYFRPAILNEAVAIKNELSGTSSMKSVLKDMKSKSRRIDMATNTSDGLVDEKTIKDIRKNVDFKGCHIEELDASRVIPFKLRDTLIGYFYVEDSDNPYGRPTSTVSTIMDKINASVYMKHDTMNQGARVESAIIHAIADKMIKCIDSKFINDNYEDMDILYEFIRLNEIHKKRKRVVFFHPDDICEFRRKDGSIMKNCMFMAKLYILTLLSNVLANVTRGADRQIHYVKTGLTTDIEGHVNSAIRAIKQGQIRYSDIGTINEIFNIVGASVDVFMPVSTDGERPIETETISGQNVDMNNDFLNSILKSIIQSFGVPSSVIDDFENIEFAKTIGMSNIDIAKMFLEAQNEICGPLTKLIRLIISYEMPDFVFVDEIFAKLTPPLVIVNEMNKERIDSIGTISETLSKLLFAQNDNETNTERKIRLFQLEYFKRNMPTLDWDAIEEMTTTIKQQSKKEELENELTTPQDTGGGYDNYSSQSQGGNDYNY